MTLKEVAIIMKTTCQELQADKRWSVSLPGVEVKHEGTLTGAVGFGNTVAAARKDLVNEIAGETLVKNAYRATRWEVTLPETISARL